jgi:hypothetical protein
VIEVEIAVYDVCICINICTYMYMYICMYIYIYIYVYICIDLIEELMQINTQNHEISANTGYETSVAMKTILMRKGKLKNMKKR